MISRAHRSPISDWWWTVDRPMLGLALLLLLSGFVLSFAASPPVAERLDLDSLHFVLRHAKDVDLVWIRGAKEQFDRINVRITHIIDESLFDSDSRRRLELPSSQWTVVTENANRPIELAADFAQVREAVFRAGELTAAR